MSAASPDPHREQADPRARARELAREARLAGRPLEWYDRLYREAREGRSVLPWHDGAPSPLLVQRLDALGPPAPGARALVVGCGMGDDAAAVQALGWRTTAFDISPTAAAWCRERFPDAGIEFVTANLLEPPADWSRAFALVVEVNTLQSMPPPERGRALHALPGTVAPGGTLLVIARGRDEGDPVVQPPWPLTRTEIEALAGDGLALTRFDDLADDERPPVRRFVVELRRST